MTAAELMRAGADQMETCGWADRIRHDPQGRVCVLGAFENALSITRLGELDGMPVLKEIADALSINDQRGPNYALAVWSNTSNGKAVVAALREAATKLEAKS